MDSPFSAIDPVTTAGLVAREVRTGRRDGALTRVAVARRTYPTDRADLWDAVTNAERIPRWFLPVSGELRPGGHYQLEGNAGGVVERCDEPESFAVTWEFGGMTSWLAVSLAEAVDGTTLELVHEAPVDPEMWALYGPGAVGLGWDLGLMALGLHLETGKQVDPEAGAAFPLTPEGRQLIRLAATGWADAAVADGDDPEPARRASDTAYAAYTTAPEDSPEQP
jgi:uncharacterized protein YndB with AHSA1/START domain